jgi:hypothetical protein
LRRLGFDLLAFHEDRELSRLSDDVEILKWARSHQRVFLSVDLFRGDTGKRMQDEIARRGGRVIKVGGGPEQPMTRFLGKVLIHQERWEPFLLGGHGWVHIQSGDSGKCRMDRPEDLDRMVWTETEQGRRYVSERDAARRGPPRKRGGGKTYTEVAGQPLEDWAKRKASGPE